jgi:hypothetical protein
MSESVQSPPLPPLRTRERSASTSGAKIGCRSQAPDAVLLALQIVTRAEPIEKARRADSICIRTWAIENDKRSSSPG